MHQVRSVTLTGYLEVASFVGLDGRRMLRRAGIPLEALEDPENRLPAGPVIRLIEDSAAQSGCENFGLLMAEARSFASLGPLSLLLERLPNVREIVRAAISFQGHLNDVVTISIEDHGDTCLVRIDLEPGYWSVQIADNSVAMAYRVLTHASGNRWRPACVHLMREAPRDIAPWRRFFSADLEFAASCNGLSASCASMLILNPLADETMARHARRLLSLVPRNRDRESASDRVRRVITLLLPSGRATLAQAAAQLGLSPRSLQRQLGEEGHRFAELLDAVRRELAVAYLAGSSHSITAVAGLLGYASPSSFTRWFAGEFGVSPQAWRGGRATPAPAGPPPTWRR
jgi:AraC-like DNA-binding protein